MSVTRTNVEATKAFIRARLGNRYIYGGALSPSDTGQGTDCSEVWQTVLEMALGRYQQGRQGEGATTESYRYVKVGERGPFGTIRVARPQDIPADAAAKLAFHHGAGGGANSHMWGELDGMLIESGGSKGLVTAPQALLVDNPYATAWAYLPGPIGGVASLGIGSTGSAVIALQERLNRGGAGLEVDGEFGPLTESEVARYQQRVGVTADPLGVAGAATLKALELVDENTWVPTPPAAGLSRTDRYALAVISEGKRRNISDKGICIALSVPFVESGWKMYANKNIPASLQMPHDDVGSDHDSTGLFQQRQAWGSLSDTMDPARSAGLFYDGGAAGQRGLRDFPYDTNAKTPGGWAQAVQVSAFPDRYDEHFKDAVALYNKLSSTPTEGGFLMALSEAEQREMLDLLRQQSGIQRRSLSPLRHLGEGNTNTVTGFSWATDGSVHILVMYLLATLGHPPTLQLLSELAGADLARYPDRADGKNIAQAMLNAIQMDTPAPVIVRQPEPAALPYIPPAPEVRYIPPAPEPVLPQYVSQAGGTAGVIASLYEALDGLGLADALPPESRAPLDALISVLQTKTTG